MTRMMVHIATRTSCMAETLLRRRTINTLGHLIQQACISHTGAHNSFQ